MYKNSKFFGDACLIFEKVKTQVNNNQRQNSNPADELNKFYCPKLLATFIKRYVSHLPLIMNCRMEKLKKDFIFTSNIVEGSFHTLKDYLEKNQPTYGPTPLPPGRLTEAVHKLNIRKMLPFKLNYKNTKTSVINPSKNPEDYRLDRQCFLTESWSRKQRKTVKPYDRPSLGLRGKNSKIFFFILIPNLNFQFQVLDLH